MSIIIRICKYDDIYHRYLLAGVQDRVPPDHVPAGGVRQPHLQRRRVLPGVHA